MSEKLLEQTGVVDLLETSFGGIRKVLYYERGSSDNAWVAVEDNKGPNFTVDIPKEMPEGKNLNVVLQPCDAFRSRSKWPREYI